MKNEMLFDCVNGSVLITDWINCKSLAQLCGYYFSILLFLNIMICRIGDDDYCVGNTRSLYGNVNL